MSQHVFSNSRFGDVDSEFEQLTVYSWSTPHGIVATHHPDQITNLLRHSGASGLPAPDFPSPVQTKALAMPGDDRLWLHDQQSGFPVRPELTEPDPHNPIDRPQLQPPRRRPAQHAELVPQGKILQAQFDRGLTQAGQHTWQRHQVLKDRRQEQITLDQLQSLQSFRNILEGQTSIYVHLSERL